MVEECLRRVDEFGEVFCAVLDEGEEAAFEFLVVNEIGFEPGFEASEKPLMPIEALETGAVVIMVSIGSSLLGDIV